MAQGKDLENADGLGGVHKVAVPRQPIPTPARDPEPVIVAHGERAGLSRLVDDSEQVTKVVHTQDPPTEPPSDTNARESTLRPMRTPNAPFQDVQISPDEPSVWTTEKDPSHD